MDRPHIRRRPRPSRLSRRQFLRRAPGFAAGAWALSRGGLFSPAQALIGPAPSGGVWLTGDFHCHTVLSHDVWSPNDDNTENREFYTWGWTAGEQILIAESRGLDFLAVTDHNRTDALFLPEYRSSKLTLVPGYEHSLSGGHAGVFAPDRSAFTDLIRDTDGSTGFRNDDGVARFVAAVRERGGLAVLNHPFYGNESEGEAVAWGYSAEASRAFDAVEVWNIGWPARHDTVRFVDPDNYLSAPWWENEFLPYANTAAIGGSDNHWRSTTAIHGVGQPTTWVYAADRSPGAILDAVRAGRTFIAAEPPRLGGVKLLLDAREDWTGGDAAMVGGKLRAEGPLEVTVKVVRGMGQKLRLISTGMVVATEIIALPNQTFTYRVVLPPRGWLRAEVLIQRGLWMSALTSAIHAYDRAPAEFVAEPTRGPAVSYGKELPTAAVLDRLPL
ncbi:MAG: CehA/McbA family metallohydrolase [Actinobacteria bacterium]|nr:CehA/McbA family metallohydrolase [Actinomycetota bacterium]